MGETRSGEELVEELRSRIHPHQNRSSLKNRILDARLVMIQAETDGAKAGVLLQHPEHGVFSRSAQGHEAVFLPASGIAGEEGHQVDGCLEDIEAVAGPCVVEAAHLKARRGLPAQEAEEHPQLIAASEVCGRIGICMDEWEGHQVDGCLEDIEAVAGPCVVEAAPGKQRSILSSLPLRRSAAGSASVWMNASSRTGWFEI